MWPTMRWSGRTERASMCQVRCRTSRVEAIPKSLCSRAAAQLGRLVDGGEVGAEDPARPQRLLGMGQHLPRLGQVEQDPVEAPLRRSPRRRRGSPPGSGAPSPTMAATLRPGPVGEVLPQLVADHLGAGPQEGHRQRPGAHPGLEHPHARGDVRLDEDGAEVLRVDDLGASRHLEHGVGQGRSHHHEPPAGAARGRWIPRVSPIRSSWATMPTWVWKEAPVRRVIRYRRSLASTSSTRSPARRMLRSPSGGHVAQRPSDGVGDRPDARHDQALAGLQLGAVDDVVLVPGPS